MAALTLVAVAHRTRAARIGIVDPVTGMGSMEDDFCCQVLRFAIGGTCASPPDDGDRVVALHQKLPVQAVLL